MMYMLVCLACVWLSLVPSRLATASSSGSGDNLLSPSSNEIVVCGDMQYLNATNDCNDLPAVFNIIFNQTSYSIALNESSAIAGNPLIHFTIFARGSLISESVTKSLDASISSNTGFGYFSLDPNMHELGMTSISSQPVPSVFVVSGTIWVSPNKLPPPDVYIMTLRATVIARPYGFPLPITEETSVNITLLETNPCDLAPCANGVCTKVGVIGYACTCPPLFTGLICDIPYDPCVEEPCANGATCSLNSSGFVCTCVSGYTGETCVENINDCIGVDCGNGTCQDQLAGYVCVCQTGYTGEHCETNIDDCASDPCLSGQCRDLVSGFYCDCGQPVILTQEPRLSESTVIITHSNTVLMTTTVTLWSPSPSLTSPPPSLASSQNCVAINIVLAVLLVTTTLTTACLAVFIIVLARKLKTSAKHASYVSPAVESSVVIDAGRPCFGEEEKDAYIEMFEQMV